MVKLLFVGRKAKLMVKKIYLITACIISISLYSCSKKTTPTTTPETVSVVTDPSVKTDSVVVKKPVAKPKAKSVPSVPKVIVVSDAGAKKAVDGRLYYDMQGCRYWRSNKDGKYYLYNKSMHTDPNFKAPAKNS